MLSLRLNAKSLCHYFQCMRIDWRKQWDTQKNVENNRLRSTIMPSYTEEPKWYACMRVRACVWVLFLSTAIYFQLFIPFIYFVSHFFFTLSIVGWPIQTNSQSTFSICFYFYSLSMFIVNDATHSISKSPLRTRWEWEMQANTNNRRWKK